MRIKNRVIVSPCCLAGGKTGELQIMHWQGFTVDDYGFTPAFFTPKRSSFHSIREIELINEVLHDDKKLKGVHLKITPIIWWALSAQRPFYSSFFIEGCFYSPISNYFIVGIKPITTNKLALSYTFTVRKKQFLAKMKYYHIVFDAYFNLR